MTRTKALLDEIRWSQPKLSEYLGTAQSTVSRLVTGQPEKGPQRRLLDQLALSHGLNHLTFDAFATSTPPGLANEAPAASPGGGGLSLSETGEAAR